MTTMLEKAAREVFDTWVRLSGVPEYGAEPYWLAYKDKYAELARAALQAIREVPEEISNVAIYDEYDWAGRNFTAMIDAILDEKTT